MATYDVVKTIETGLLIDPVLVSGDGIAPGAVIELDPAKQPPTIGLYIDGGWLVKRPAIRLPEVNQNAPADANQPGSE